MDPNEDIRSRSDFRYRMETVEAIEEGLASMERGEGEDAEFVFAQLEEMFPFLQRGS